MTAVEVEPQTALAPVTSERIGEARKALGQLLARYRNATGMLQDGLARRTAYSRSTVAGVESGRQNGSRIFWEQADRDLGARGELVNTFEELNKLIIARRAHLAWQLEQERLRRHGVVIQSTEPPRGPAVETPECGCSFTVARWGGRETLALREALRLSLRAFAERLGVATATVSKWEDRRQPAPPTLAMQAVLDSALTLADQDARARFAKIMQMPPDKSNRIARHATVTHFAEAPGPRLCREGECR